MALPLGRGIACGGRGAGEARVGALGRGPLVAASR